MVFRIGFYNNGADKKMSSGNSETVRDENYAGDSVNPLPCMQGNGPGYVWPQTTYCSGTGLVPIYVCRVPG